MRPRRRAIPFTLGGRRRGDDRLAADARGAAAGSAGRAKRGDGSRPASTTRWSRSSAAMARRAGLEEVVLTGGCFQNAFLLTRAVKRLLAEGFSPYWPQQIPTNDGGIALGQVARRGARWTPANRRNVPRGPTRESEPGNPPRSPKIPCVSRSPEAHRNPRDEQGVRMAKANFGGIVKRFASNTRPRSVPGDYVLVHVGFALSKVDEEEAARTYQLLEEMEQLGRTRCPRGRGRPRTPREPPTDEIHGRIPRRGAGAQDRRARCAASSRGPGS